MSVFKKLFNKKEPFLHTPNQEVPGLDPLVVHAIENLFPNTEVQNQAFEFSLQFLESKKGDILMLLAALSMGIIDIDSPNLNDGRFWMEAVHPNFSNMKAAQRWVKSRTKPQE